MPQSEVAFDLPEPMAPFLDPWPFKIAHGGRDCTKSWSIADLLIYRGQKEKVRILCGREYQRSLKDSVHRLLSDRISGLGLDARFEVRKTEIESDIGSMFIFTGFHEQSVDSMMSYEGIDICWVEQAERVTAESANVLIPTIFRKPGSEIWASMNPKNESDYFYDRFVAHKDPDAVVCKLSYLDNRWFTPAMNAERLKMKALNDDLYRHIWLGECRNKAGMLFKRKWFKYYDNLPFNLNIYMASDYAVTPPDESNPAPDWTEHGVWGLDTAGDLYAVDWWSGQTSPAEWIDAAVDLIQKWSPKLWLDENGVIRRAVDGEITKALRLKHTWIVREGITSAGAKAERALGFAARASMGAVYLPRTEWAERLVNQLCAFTGQDGHTDDMVDVCSLLSRGIEKMQDAQPVPQPVDRSIIPFTKPWIEGLDRQDRLEAEEKARYYR
jgi:predicted phage terminase large subunit-like protein